MREGTRPPLSQAFRALRNRNYALFWSGQIVSQAGTWMQRIGQSWLVLKLTDSPLAVGTVATVQFMPLLLLSLFGGVIADRVKKRKLLIITQSIMLVQAVVLAVLTASGKIELIHVYILAAVLGTTNALDNPTRQSFVIEMVGPDDLQNAVALNSTQFNVARLLGPALGGLTIAAIGISGCFFLNAASYLAVLAGLILIRPDQLFAAPQVRKGAVLRQIGEGLRYAVTTPDIALVFLLMAAIGTFGYNFTVILPLIARFVLHSGPIGIGLLTSVMGIGSLLASLGVAYAGRPSRKTLLVGGTLFSIILMCVGLSRWWVLTAPLVTALGVSSIIFSTTANTRLQLITPAHLRGRVMSIYSLLFAGTTPIGATTVGFLSDWFGVGPAITQMGAVCLLGVIAAFVYARRKRGELLTALAEVAAASPTSTPVRPRETTSAVRS